MRGRRDGIERSFLRVVDPELIPNDAVSGPLDSMRRSRPLPIQRQPLSVGLRLKLSDFIAGSVGVGLAASRLQDFGEVSQ
jgi:hypothetical protein